jgi:hypothetical protein
MKRSAKPLCPQMNLPLFSVPATGMPNDQQKELALVLMDLLIKAAEVKKEQPINGGEDESETHA